MKIFLKTNKGVRNPEQSFAILLDYKLVLQIREFGQQFAFGKSCFDHPRPGSLDYSRLYCIIYNRLISRFYLTWRICVKLADLHNLLHHLLCRIFSRRC
jgi:hypothetical protein